ncbi:hypothetical protein P3T18_001221 [Paraburkholderia sp. GAS199]|uniref:hypothetical protein n=1 Tax=Paraburkholderia sp. GAS199 TaxID=3035126 RepID=UPI003D1CC9AC
MLYGITRLAPITLMLFALGGCAFPSNLVNDIQHMGDPTYDACRRGADVTTDYGARCAHEADPAYQAEQAEQARKEAEQLSAATPVLPQTVEAPHHPRVYGPVYRACSDLMSRLRQEYGRAPVCAPFLDGNGNSTTEMTGAIGLSDHVGQNWMVLQIRTDAGSDYYSYDHNTLLVVQQMIQTQGRGPTTKEAVIYGINQQEQQVEADYQFEKSVLNSGRTLTFEGKPISLKQVEDVHRVVESSLRKSEREASKMPK